MPTLNSNRERQAMSSAPQLCALQINFPPTYKYKSGTNTYASEEAKQRMPAWCDRILWRCLNGNRPRISNDSDGEKTEGDTRQDAVQSPSAIKQLTYDHFMEALISDHKPVHSLMVLPTQVVESPSAITTLETVTSELNSLSQFDLDKGNGHTHGWSNTGRGRLLAFVAVHEQSRRDVRRGNVTTAASKATREYTAKSVGTRGGEGMGGVAKVTGAE